MVEAIVGAALRAILASVVLGGVLALLVLAATRLLALTAATRHVLWTTALIATAVMPLAGIGMPPPAPRSRRRSRSSSPAAMPRRGTRSARTPNRRDGSTPDHSPAASGGSPRRRHRTGCRGARPPSLGARFAAWTPRVPRVLALAVAMGWALGALVGMADLLASVVRVRGLRRRSSPLDAALADELPWLTAAGAGREIYLRLSYETETPVRDRLPPAGDPDSDRAGRRRRPGRDRAAGAARARPPAPLRRLDEPRPARDRARLLVQPGRLARRPPDRARARDRRRRRGGREDRRRPRPTPPRSGSSRARCACPSTPSSRRARC